MTPAHPDEKEPLVAGYYAVRYRRPGSGVAVTHLGAYSANEAGERVRRETFGEATIVSTSAIGDLEPVTCTYEGGEGAVYPEGPWVFMDYVDKWAPVIACDVHGHPAHPCVYESSDPSQPGPERYCGPCMALPEPLTPPGNTRGDEG